MMLVLLLSDLFIFHHHTVRHVTNNVFLAVISLRKGEPDLWVFASNMWNLKHDVNKIIYFGFPTNSFCKYHPNHLLVVVVFNFLTEE